MKNLLGALLKAQSEFPTLVKDASNPAYRSRYATLAAVQEAAFPILQKNGLIVLQSVRTDVADGRLIVYVGGTLFHVESGESTTQELGMVPARQDPQGVGSAITYGRRYLLMTMLGLVPDDDDGQAAAVKPATIPGSANKTLDEKSAPSRPDWKLPTEAIAYAESLPGVFRAHQHARAAFAEVVRSICGRDGVSPAELPQVFDAWHNDLLRRTALQRAMVPAEV